MNAWYSRYPGDYGRDTAHLSMIQHGAYTLLLDHYYSTAAPLPTDVAVLYRICRAFDENERKAVDFIVSQFFELRADGYHNGRADVELVKRNEHHERLSAAGRKAMQKRWGSHNQAINQAIASPQPQPQPKEEKSICAPAVRARPDYPGFERFYQAYPRKVDRKRALAAWTRIEFIEQHVETVLVGLAKWVACEQWQDEQFIPHAATFLNNRRWEAEPPKKGGSGGAKPTIGDSAAITLASHVEQERLN